MEVRLLTTQEAMKLLKIKDKDVFRDVIKKYKIPRVKYLQKNVFYDVNDINKFIDNQKII